MKILFVVPTYKPAYIYGGTIVVTAKLAENLVKLGHEVKVYTTKANGDADLDVDTSEEIDVGGVKVRYFGLLTRRGRTFIAPALWRHLNRTAKEFDVVHIHSWWNFLVIAAVWICKRKGIRPVLSPHGMFSDYILTARNQKKKEWMQRLGGKKLLQNTFLHVSSKMEESEAKRLVPDWQGAIIPNLVELPAKEYQRTQNQVFTIGFLSRIDPKKGLDILIEALSKVEFDYKLLVAGSGDEEYVKSLSELSTQCGNNDKIEWVGWKNGDEKFEFLAGLDLFALTSHSENFAIVVIESLSVSTPVLVSDQVGLYDYVRQNDCGWVCKAHIDDAVKTLNDIFIEKNKLAIIKERSKALIEKDFDPITLTNRYLVFYKSNEPNFTS